MRSHRAHTGVLITVLALAVIAAIWIASAGRSPWYDEYYTLYITRPGLPWGTAWAMWLADNHPPLFYALAWLTQGLGVGAEPRRLLNLAIALGGGVALGGIAWKRPDLRGTLTAYAIALAGSPPLVDRAAELRSNFLAFASAALAVAALVALAGSRPLSRRGALALGLTLALAWSVHLAATIVVGALALAFTLRARARPRYLALCALAALPFAVSMAVQAATIAGNTRTFWIPGGLSAARWVIEGQIAQALTASLPLTLAGLAGLALLAHSDGRARTLSPASTALAALLGGFGLALALLLAIHLQRPFVIDRYLVTLHPIVAMVLAIGVAQLAQRMGQARAWLHLVLVAAALLALVRQVERTLARPGWDGTARAIAQIVRACPATPVLADMRWNAAVLALPPAQNRAVVPWAYAQVAARHGFTLVKSLPATSPCPAVLWTEHAAAQHPAPRAVAAGQGLRGGRLQRIGDGWLFIASR